MPQGVAGAVADVVEVEVEDDAAVDRALGAGAVVARPVCCPAVFAHPAVTMPASTRSIIVGLEWRGPVMVRLDKDFVGPLRPSELTRRLSVSSFVASMHTSTDTPRRRVHTERAIEAHRRRDAR